MTAGTMTHDPSAGAARTAAPTMKALVYHGPGRRSFEDVPRPRVREAADAVVEITTTTICGTDLHILKGDVPAVTDGRILGHEGVGIVREVGAGVTRFRPGDRVVVSCITSCARCDRCRQGMPSHCRQGGWILGHLVDGTQAEFVRIPQADSSLHAAPAGVPDEALAMLSDIFPTAFECGVTNGRVQPGDTVAIVGAGPIGLAAVLTARLFSPSRIVVVDRDANRLEVARSFGATDAVSAAGEAAVAEILALSGGEGVDVAIEAVGVPETFDLCQQIVAPGGRIANVGVHGRAVPLRLEKLWAHNITLTTRLVDAVTTPMLLRMVASSQLDAAKLVTHRFRLSQAMEAYDTFASAAASRALKVVLKG
jgi:alcohol dehydrogenase